MADQAEDVLELEDELEPEIEPDQGDTDPDDEATEPDEDEEGETFVGFAGEEDTEAAPASESDSSVIREMRNAIRERDRQIRELSKRMPQEPEVELGPKPTLESCEYDEERFEAEVTAYHERKAKVAAKQAEAEEQRKAQQAAFAKKVEAFDAEKASLGIANFDEIEAEIAASLPQETVAAIMHSDKPATLMAALVRSPGKMEQLSKLNLLEAAMMIGELKAKVMVDKRKSKAAPDRGIQGRTASGGGNLEKLRQQAERSGDYSQYLAAKRAAQK
jgi:hypothetical protein